MASSLWGYSYPLSSYMRIFQKMLLRSEYVAKKTEAEIGLIPSLHGQLRVKYTKHGSIGKYYLMQIIVMPKVAYNLWTTVANFIRTINITIHAEFVHQPARFTFKDKNSSFSNMDR
jgi:hypothetical protein